MGIWQVEKDGEYPYFWGLKVTLIFFSSLGLSLGALSLVPSLSLFLALSVCLSVPNSLLLFFLFFFVFFLSHSLYFFFSFFLSFLPFPFFFAPVDLAQMKRGRVVAEMFCRARQNDEEIVRKDLRSWCLARQGREVQEPRVRRPVEARRLWLWLRYPSARRRSLYRRHSLGSPPAKELPAPYTLLKCKKIPSSSHLNGGPNRNTCHHQYNSIKAKRKTRENGWMDDDGLDGWIDGLGWRWWMKSVDGMSPSQPASQIKGGVPVSGQKGEKNNNQLIVSQLPSTEVPDRPPAVA